ncbi:nitrogenases component 1 alpha and beta subunits signature 1 [Lucifera butyrica]|uniref:Nitrogenases component 1 alpha and beta subunits signature 1 n=1 Tax=Lucifera butyrica TaxID=1351585 RepID=A0A498R450_9FIRM|nr:nitrogenase component 1 [Lucifera butyrica]VBB07456.1 nitrogenases component 1 alpha and beta subunits signature 1 [Lucifera butyrica]
MKEECCRNVNENPCNMCMPMGGILPLKGIERSMVILHGSQGCSTYMRRHISEHFSEPIDIGSSSLNEKGTIYGGEKNLRLALDNIRKVYNPQLIGVLTTCLAETIGEDVNRITAEYREQNGLDDLFIVPVSTPGYGGSHAEGYFYTLRAIIAQLAAPAPKHNKINLLLPNLSPADIREIKRLLAVMQVDYTLCPDISDTLDRPFVRPYTKMPEGGTRIADIRAMPGAPATIQMGMTVADDLSPGKYLADTFGVPLYTVPIPLGVENTDRFLAVLSEITGRPVPEALQRERGRLLDCMVDSHKYNFQGRSVIFGEPELVYAVTAVCMENGIFPVAVATGSRPGPLRAVLSQLTRDCPEPVEFLEEADFVQIRTVSRQKKANIAIGHSDGRYLTEREGIPLVRIGFPILDRVGGPRLLSVGYTGTAVFLDRLTNTLLEAKHGSYRRTLYDQYYQAN